MSTKRIFLWCVPRSLSSAFYRSISTLKNSKCLFEPFAIVRTFGRKEDRDTNGLWGSAFETGFLPTPLTTIPTYDSLKESLLQDRSDLDLLFIKDFPYYFVDPIRSEVLTSPEFNDFQHTFLIRDPKRAVYSYHKALGDQFEMKKSWMEEFGYVAQYDLYCTIREKMKKCPIVVDAIDLQTHPEETMKSYCQAVGIKYEATMTKWKPSTELEMGIWTDVNKIQWHTNLIESSGFKKINLADQEPVPLDNLPKKTVSYIDECSPLYEEMRLAKLNPLY